MNDFWERVDRRAPDECWEWRGSIGTSGYGVLSRNKRRFYAHRVAWALSNAPVPVGMFVCHHCDNPKCCNPGHLFLGTHEDNMRDRASKGRNGRKLTPGWVLVARALSSLGLPLTAVAAELGVKQGSISDILAGRSWASVLPEGEVA